MTTITTVSPSVATAARVHAELLDSFLERVAARLATTTDAFVRESLEELQAELAARQDGYRFAAMGLAALDAVPVAA